MTPDPNAASIALVAYWLGRGATVHTWPGGHCEIRCEGMPRMYVPQSRVDAARAARTAGPVDGEGVK